MEGGLRRWTLVVFRENTEDVYREVSDAVVQGLFPSNCWARPSWETFR